MLAAAGRSRRLPEPLQDRHRHLPHTAGHMARGLSAPGGETASRQATGAQEIHTQSQLDVVDGCKLNKTRGNFISRPRFGSDVVTMHAILPFDSPLSGEDRE